MLILEARLEFETLAQLFVWRAKHARHMFLTGKGGVYRLIPLSKTSVNSVSKSVKT